MRTLNQDMLETADPNDSAELIETPGTLFARLGCKLLDTGLGWEIGANKYVVSSLDRGRCLGQGSRLVDSLLCYWYVQRAIFETSFPSVRINITDQSYWEGVMFLYQLAKHRGAAVSTAVDQSLSNRRLWWQSKRISIIILSQCNHHSMHNSIQGRAQGFIVFRNTLCPYPYLNPTHAKV